MKWYGKSSLTDLNHGVFLKNLDNKLKKKTLNFSSPCRLAFKPNKIFLYLPLNWHFLIFKNHSNFCNLFYFYNNIYFFFLPYNYKTYTVFYDRQLNLLTFSFLFSNNFSRYFWNFYKNIFFTFFTFFFKKLKFKGKGYYAYKDIRNTVALQFGFSHRVRIYFIFLFVKLISKTTVFFFGINKKDVLHFSYYFFKIRPINIFTSKGIRFSRQIVYKKVGKVSSYR